MMFIDGKLQSETFPYTDSTAIVADITCLGQWGNLSIRHFHGSIDDVRISTEALYPADFIPSCPGQAS